LLCLRKYGFSAPQLREGVAAVKKIIALIGCGIMAGCQYVPAEGPLAGDIVKQAGLSATEQSRTRAQVFELVDVDNRVTQVVASHQTKNFQRRFNVRAGVREPVVGVGDQLKIVIFEASPDGLFSTADSKQTPFDVVVQTDGKAAIPYVGTVQLSGKTIEQVRQTIIEALKNKAVEPDVLVNLSNTASRNVSVTGAVARSAVIPLGLVNETLMDVIAKAGGATHQPYETYVNLTRNQVRGSVLLKTILENPRENIYVQPGDQVYLVHNPRTFTVLGSVRSTRRVDFGANDLNLLEAIALAGGADDNTADIKGYFIFRYEEPEILTDLVGPQRVAELVNKGMSADKDGRYPIVYRFGMDKADSLLIGQNFPIKDRDVIYASRHPSVDFGKFLNIIGRPIGTAAAAVSIANVVTD
jgi:polysaccharide biosynthesis/export protein